MRTAIKTIAARLNVLRCAFWVMVSTLVGEQLGVAETLDMLDMVVAPFLERVHSADRRAGFLT
jgi:hypothetical protein